MSMKVKFTNTDSTGKSATKRLRFEFEGEYYEVTPGDGNVAEVPESVGKRLAESNRSSVTLPDEARPDEPGPPEQPTPDRPNQPDPVAQSDGSYQPGGSSDVEDAARDVIETMELDGDAGADQESD